MNLHRFAAVAALLTSLCWTQAATFTVPREKISLVCTDRYFKVSRVDFVLQDEDYPACKLMLPLALRERWPGRRTFL